jgi:hypothetical protein
MENKNDEYGLEGFEMLSFILDDALRGIDIKTRYPTFYRRMLANGELRRAFLDGLDILERSRSGKLEPLPGPPRQDLNFLRTELVKRTVEWVNGGNWRAIWQQTIDQLQMIFFSPSLQQNFAYRDEDNFLENKWFSLFRDEVEIDGVNYAVLLEASTLLENPEALDLTLAVGITPQVPEGGPIPGSLLANLKWGNYQQAVMVTERGRANFPPLPLMEVLDETGNYFIADLRLSLEAVSL